MKEELQTMLKDCHLCPRNCGVDRLAGQKGFCGVDAGIMVARKRPSYVGRTVYFRKRRLRGGVFSGCSLGCAFCQNRTISKGQSGKVITVEYLAELFWICRHRRQTISIW